MPIVLKASGDPRRPAEVHKYERPKVNLEEQPPDVFLLMALASGLASLVLKAKVPAWASLLFVMCGVANGRAGHADYKQYISSLTFSLFGLVSSYLVPMRQRTGAGPAGPAAG